MTAYVIFGIYCSFTLLHNSKNLWTQQCGLRSYAEPIGLNIIFHHITITGVQTNRGTEVLLRHPNCYQSQMHCILIVTDISLYSYCHARPSRLLVRSAF